MTNPPQDREERGGGIGPDAEPGRPVPPPGTPEPHGAPYVRPPVPQPPPGQQPPYGPPQYGPPQYGPPQYGPPQYGQPAYAGPPYAPPEQPASKSRVGLIAAVTVGILALLALGVFLALNLSTTVLDRTAVERDVAAQFEEREGVAIDLECAEEMKVEADAAYECTGTTADGEDVTLRIAITDEDTAAYTWTEP